MFDSDLLQNFLNILDYGGFTAAANSAYSTQSTVSAKLLRLEEQVGYHLMNRNRRGIIALTQQGKEIEMLARETIRLHTLTRRRLDEKPVRGKVKLGMSDDIACAGNYPKLLAEFCQDQPDIQLDVTVGSGPELQRALERGEVDHVLCKMLRDLPENAVKLWQEELIWIGQPDIYTDRQAELQLVTFTPPCRYRERAFSVLDNAGLRWRPIYVSPSLSGVQAAVEAGLGVSVLPRSLATDRRLHLSANMLPRPGTISFIALSRQAARDRANVVFKEMLKDLLPPHANHIDN